MIKFFRNIRKKLLAEGKTTNYLKYAIGEIVLVVIGILIALQVNNWNETRKLNNERTKLVKELISDFKITKSRLSESIEYGRNTNKNTDVFLSLSEEDILIIPIDSLANLTGYFFDKIDFEPMLATYNRILSSGTKNLIENDSLFKLFPDFFQAFDSYKLHDNLGGDLVYKGSTWELRRTLGSLNVLNRNQQYPKSFELSEKQYRNLLLQKNVYATCENMAWIFRNILNKLVDMEIATDKILIQLKKSLKQND